MQTSCTRSLVLWSQTLSSIVQASGRGTCTIPEGKGLASYRTHSSKFNLKHSQSPCRTSQLWLEWGHTQNAGNTLLCSPDWLGELLSSVRENSTVHCTLQCTIQGWREWEWGSVWTCGVVREWGVPPDFISTCNNSLTHRITVLPFSSVREDSTVHCTLQCTIQGWHEKECGDVWDGVRYRGWCNEGVGCPSSSPLNHSPVLSLHTTCFQ